MAFMAKQRAQRHYDAGTRILASLNQSLSIHRDLKEAVKHMHKDFDAAITHLQKAVILDPGFADAFHNLAHAWYQVAEYNIVTARLRGFRSNPQEDEDNIRGALEFALDAVDQALAIRYEFPQAHNTRAMILAKLLRLDEAMEATELALSQYPDYENARDNQEKIEEMIRERATIPGYKNESSFLENVKELRKTQSKIWKDLRK